MANYIRGNQGYVMLSDKQATYGTAKAPTYTGTIAAGEDLQLVKPQKAVMTDRIRNKVAPTFVTKGMIHTEGTLTYDLIPDEAEGINLAMTLGVDNTVSGGATSGYTHTFKAWSACTDMPKSGITVQKLVGGCDNTMLVDNISQFVNTFELTVPEEGIVTYAVNYMGMKNIFGSSSLATPTYSNVAPFEGWMAHIEIGATLASTTAVSIKAANLSIDNKLQMIPDRNVASQYPLAFASNGREVTMSLELTQENSLTLYNYFLNDNTNAVKLILTHPDNAGTVGGKYSLTINLPKVTWLGEEPKLDSADVLTGSYNLQALWDSTLGYDIQAVLVNSQSGTYSV
jgi:hypothetical protein